jgi:hypothetical protein
MSGLLVFVVVEHHVPVAPVALNAVFSLSVEKWYQKGRYSVDYIGFKGVEADFFRLRAQPRNLALRQLTRGHKRLVARLLQRTLADCVGPELAVAYRAHRWRIPRQLWPLEQHLHFIKEAIVYYSI